jgi:superfamily II DNA/RNA helicase
MSPQTPRRACDVSSCRASRYIQDDPLTSFNEFGLAEPILRALSEEQYTTPTPIQSDAIPVVVAGRDIVGIAQTGTGKTAAFALPILNRLAANRRRAERKSCRVLVLSPTRELSGQILDSFRTYGRHVGISSALVIGGVPMGRQVRELMNGLDVLVATPGRLLDLVRSNALRLNQVEVLVLDEADRMLDMGFIHDIRTIVAKLPKERQTLLFSATMPREIADLAAQMLRDPARVAVTPVASTQERVDQRIILTDRAAKPTLLVEVLREEAGQALVFTRTKHGADKVARHLSKSGIPAEAIHGNKSQNQRERVLGAFRAGKLKTLVATDIAARGIDVTGISHVVNYDLPNIAESYVHRIGRTARAGAAGVATSLCDHEERAYLRDIEKLIQMTIPSTDKRNNPQASAPAQHHRPQQQNRNARNGNRRNGQQQRRHGGGTGHSGRNEHAHQGRSENGHQGKPRHNGQRQGQRQGQKRDNGGNRHAPRPSSPDNIGTVGFMQAPSRPAQVAGDEHRTTR